MNVTITESAVNLYKQEMGLSDKENVTLFVRVGGVGSGGFSVGIRKGRPDVDAVKKTVLKVNFFIPVEEAWYFDGMIINFDEDLSQMIFSNSKIDDVTNPNSN